MNIYIYVKIYICLNVRSILKKQILSGDGMKFGFLYAKVANYIYIYILYI